MSETKKALTQVDKSTKALEAAVKSLSTFEGGIELLAKQQTDLAFEIEQMELKLKAIKEEIKEEERKERAELQIRILENEANVLGFLLEKNDLAGIKTSELHSIRMDLSKAESDNSQEITDAIDKERMACQRDRDAALTEKQALHMVEVAQLKADNAALGNKVQFLTESLAQAHKAIDDERAARVEMATKSSQPTFNVGTSNGK